MSAKGTIVSQKYLKGSKPRLLKLTAAEQQIMSKLLLLLELMCYMVFIVKERRQELSRLQPISENAWLKRSSSDPSLTQVGL